MSRSTRTRQTTDDRLTRRRFLGVGAAALGTVMMPAYGAGRRQGSPRISATDLGGLTLFEGAGCNVVAMRGADGAGSDAGALMIDGGLAVNSGALLGAVRNATGNSRIHTLINTHWHPEQTGSNEAVGQDGGVIIAHEKTAMYLASAVMSITFDGRYGPLPAAARPNQTTRDGGSLEFAGQQIDYGYLPAAHTDGDIYIHFPEMNVLVVGGVLSGNQWPLVDYRNGAWLGGRVRAAEALAEIVTPDTRVVTSDGPLLTGSDVARQRDIYKELFLEFIDYMNMGMGPEDAEERNPLAQYEAEFGDPSAFLYGAYRSMLLAYVPD